MANTTGTLTQAQLDAVNNGLGSIGTEGDLFYRDATGLQKLAKGTSGQTLKMGGSNAPEWATVTAPEPGLKLIQEVSITSVANIDLTGFDDTKYSRYQLYIENLRPVTASYLRIQFSSDGGSNFYTTYSWPNGYSWNAWTVLENGSIYQQSNNSNATYIRLSNKNVRADAYGKWNQVFDILGTPATVKTTIQGTAHLAPDGGGAHFNVIGGGREQEDLTNAIRLSMSSGNFYAQGVVRLFGLTTTV